MNFQRKPAALNVFDADIEDSSYIVDELMFTDVIELMGITPVDSVRRMHRDEVIDSACDQYQRYYDYFDKRWEEDAQRLLDRDFV